MKPRSSPILWALVLVSTLFAVAEPAWSCDKASVTQITVQGDPRNPHKVFKDKKKTVKHTIYYCTGEFQCNKKEITFVLDTGPDGKTQSQLAQELADAIKAALPAAVAANVKVVDNVISIYGTNSCSGTGDPSTPEKPTYQPPNTSDSALHTSQRTWPM